MAQIEALEFALDLEGDLAAQTRSRINHAYTSMLRTVCQAAALKPPCKACAIDESCVYWQRQLALFDGEYNYS
jgi:endonuclease III